MGNNVVTTDLATLNSSSAVNNINENTDKLSDAFDQVIWKDGREEMTGNLDMDGYRIYNLADPSNATDAVNKRYVDNSIAGVGGDGGGGSGGGGGTTVTIGDYYNAEADSTKVPSGLRINDGDIYSKGTRDVYLDWFYNSPSDTDTDALLRFARLVNSGVYNDVTLHFVPGKGRGPIGRYLVEQEILIGPVLTNVVLDFGNSTIRYTTPASKFRYLSVQSGSSTSIPNTFFVMRGGSHQYAAAVDCIGFWDFPYITTRFGGTGYAEDMRIAPQNPTDTGMTLMAAFRTKNTWHWFARDCHVAGKITSAGASSLLAGSSFVAQSGLCIVSILDNVSVTAFDKIFIPGTIDLVGVNGTLSGGGSLGRGKMIRQGANTAILGGSALPTWNYVFYNEVGTITTGPCELINTDGSVAAGTFTISSLGHYVQASEAIQVHGGSVFTACNYFINADSSTAINKFLNWGFHDMHCAYNVSFIKVKGVADLQVGTNTFLIANVAGSVAFDVDTADLVNITGMSATTNGLGGTFFKGRNITNGSVIGNGINFYNVPWNIDNTVKSFTIANNTAYEVGQTFTPVSTANRYNTQNTRGVRFRNNGIMGRGFDIDDPQMIAFTPTLSADTGTFASVDWTGGFFNYNITNGVFTFAMRVKITRGTAAGSLYITMPKLPTNTGPINIPYGFSCHASVGYSGTTAIYNPTTNLLEIGDAGTGNTTDSAFKLRNLDLNLVTTYFVTGSIPVEFS